MVLISGKVTVPASAPGVYPSLTVTDAAITTAAKVVLTPAELDNMTDTRGQMEFYVSVAAGSFTISGELVELKDNTDLFYICDTDGAGSTGFVTYKGVWDASGGVYPAAPGKGDYYVISVSGTMGGVAYTVGDWAVYNGATWDKVEGPGTLASEITNDSTYAGATVKDALDKLTIDVGAKLDAPETDPVFGAWLSAVPLISTFNNDVPYLISFTETDPVFSAWLLATPPLFTETDPVFSAWLLATPPVMVEADPVFSAWLLATPPLYTETDPVVGAITGIVKADGAGNISAAASGTDYLAPNATADGTYPVYNDGVTSGQLASITLLNGLVTAVTVVP